MSYDPSYIDPNSPLVLSDTIPSSITITPGISPLSISNGGILPGFSPYDLNGYRYTVVNDPAFETIKGEMLTIKMEISEWEFENSMIPKPEIKRRLVSLLAEELLEHKNIEFTYQKNHDNGNISVRARCFVVPDDQVKILRTKNEVFSK